MKRKIILSTAGILVTIYSFGQEKKVAESAKSNLENFSEKAGTMVKKEYIPLGKIARITFQILKITDLSTNKTESGLRISREGYIGYSTMTTQIAFLDADEIDGFVSGMKYCIKNVLPTSAEGNDLEYNFMARDGLTAGVYNNKGKWTAYIKLEQYQSNSNVVLNLDEFGQMEDMVDKAKARL